MVPIIASRKNSKNKLNYYLLITIRNSTKFNLIKLPIWAWFIINSLTGVFWLVRMAIETERLARLTFVQLISKPFSVPFVQTHGCIVRGLWNIIKKITITIHFRR